MLLLYCKCVLYVRSCLLIVPLIRVLSRLWRQGWTGKPRPVVAVCWGYCQTPGHCFHALGDRNSCFWVELRSTLVVEHQYVMVIHGHPTASIIETGDSHPTSSYTSFRSHVQPEAWQTDDLEQCRHWPCMDMAQNLKIKQLGAAHGSSPLPTIMLSTMSHQYDV